MAAPIKNTKVYEEVITKIKEKVSNGTLKKGDKLPSERDLAVELNASRTSIREALRALEVIGFIECRQGEGNYIKNTLENILLEPLSLMFMLQESSPEDILELRKILETETSAVAAKKISSIELSELKVLIEKLKISKSEEKNAQIDKEFHYKIAEATGNFLIVNFLKSISALMDAFIKDARNKILANASNKEELIKQHEDIYEGLFNHNPKDAADAMRKHLDFANEYMNKI